MPRCCRAGGGRRRSTGRSWRAMRETGVCIMQMEAGLDTGPVLLREATPIGAEETTADLHDRLSRDGRAADRARRWRGLPSLPPEPQPAEGVTYAAKIDKAEARVDWTRPAVEVDRLIRGLSPFPGAWSTCGGERVKLLRSRLADGSGRAGAGAGRLYRRLRQRARSRSPRRSAKASARCLRQRCCGADAAGHSVLTSEALPTMAQGHCVPISCTRVVRRSAMPLIWLLIVGVAVGFLATRILRVDLDTPRPSRWGCWAR